MRCLFHIGLGGLVALMSAQAVRAAVPVPGQQPLERIDFERHVMGLFSKAGCNNGSCHGSFQGKGGFRLSLFGYDPHMDFNAVVRDGAGRRLDTTNPGQSLLLRKAAGQMPHEGTARIAVDSWQYQIIRDWIAGGAQWRKGTGELAKLELDASDFALVKSGDSRQLHVTAHFADGTSEPVAAFCEFRVADEAVAEVSASGRITARQPGDTSLVVAYRGVVRGIRVLVPAAMPDGKAYPETATSNFIDREVSAKLKLLNMIPSARSTDEEFLRRVTIDTIGCLPTPTEVRAFLADSSRDKRAKMINELLAHPLHAALWATRLSDVTGNNTDGQPNPQNLKAKRSQQWHDWLRKRIAENRPYDEIVHGILTATSREGRPVKDWVDEEVRIDEQMAKGFTTDYPQRDTLDLYWKQINTTLEQRGEKVAAAFLGVRLECAQCHKHPTDRWTQTDYRAFANLFQQVTVGASPEARDRLKKINDERREAAGRKNQVNPLTELFLGQGGTVARNGRPVPNPRALKHPDTGEALAPRPLGGAEIPLGKGDDLREKLWNWMVAPDNPYFAKSFVNRVWAHYFGVGLVDPVDDFSVANPPTNPRLLDALAREFVEHKFDIRHIERTVLNSETYQRSSLPNETNRLDRNNYARSYLRPLMAESVVDVLNSALGVTERFGPEAPAGVHMIEVGSSRINNGALAYALRIFGRPPRASACDCERTAEPALPQTLYRMSDPAVQGKLTARDGRLTKLLRERMNDDELLEELFVATLGRRPTDDEKGAFAGHVISEPNRAKRFQDALWALINTREFILNH